MAFTLETLEDFDQTIFDRGAGWAIVFEIHNAILARAQVTGHTLRNTIANQFSGLLWLEEGYNPVRPELRSKLSTMYSWIGQLISGNTEIRWTETSGRSAEWTIATLTADIGMGDFDDLLVKPQRPEPLVWLIAALNRLRHPKFTVSKTLAISPVGEMESRFALGSEAFLETPDDVWDELLGTSMNYTNVSSNQVRWRAAQFGIGNYEYQETRSAGGITHAKIDARSALTTTANDYLLFAQRSWYSGPDFEVVVGSSEPTRIMSSTFLSPTVTVEATDVDMTISGSEQVAIRIDTAIPSDPPFNGFWPSGGSSPKYGYILAEVRQIVFYCDLPDVLGIGELDAPVPTVAGDNE